MPLRQPGSIPSDAIEIARLICILGVVYVHAWTGRTGDQLAALAQTPQGWLRWGLVDLLGRGAVPLLSVVSGWLVAQSARRRGWAAFVAGKARTLLAPMLAWNAIAMLLVCGAAALGLLAAPTPPGPPPKGALWVANELLCLTAPNDVNVQMYFLRDLFVCMLAAPLLVRLPSVAVAAVAAGAAAWAIGGWSLPVLLKPQILAFFCLGLLARRGGWETPLARSPWIAVVAPFCLLAPAEVLVSIRLDAAPGPPPPWTMALELCLRLSAAALFWRIAAALARGPARATLLRLAPLAFLIFCAHLTLIWLAGPLIGRLTGPLGSPAYPLFLILQPLLALAAAILLRAALAAAAPGALAFLSGGRALGWKTGKTGT